MGLAGAGWGWRVAGWGVVSGQNGRRERGKLDGTTGGTRRWSRCSGGSSSSLMVSGLMEIPLLSAQVFAFVKHLQYIPF